MPKGQEGRGRHSQTIIRCAKVGCGCTTYLGGICGSGTPATGAGDDADVQSAECNTTRCGALCMGFGPAPEHMGGRVMKMLNPHLILHHGWWGLAPVAREGSSEG